MFQLVSVTSHSSMHLWEQSCFVFSTSFHYLVVDRTPSNPSLLTAKHPCSVSLFSYTMCFQASNLLGSPALNLLQHINVLYWGAQNCMRYSKCSLMNLKQKGGISRLYLLATLLLLQPRMQPAAFATGTHCWLTFSLLLNRSCRSFPVKLSSISRQPLAELSHGVIPS